MTVVDADTVLEGVVNRDVLAEVFRLRIVEAIDDYRKDRAPALLMRHALHALAATVVLFVGIFLGRRALLRGHGIVAGRYGDRIQGIGIQSFQIIGPDQLRRILRGIEKFFVAAGLLTAIYLYLNYVLSLFPWTREFAGNLFSVVVNPLQTMGRGLLQMVPGLVFLIILFIFTRYVLALIYLFFEAVESGRITVTEFEPAWAKPTYRLVRVFVVALALVVAYPYIPGSGSEGFKGVSLFIGVLVSLGSQSLIGNIIAGFTLIYRRTFKPGDRVQIGDHVGIVEQSRVMATYLRTIKNETVVVPNSNIINEDITNFSTLAQQRGLILHTTVGIGYETPWRQVEAMLLEAAARTPGLMREPKPFVLQKALGDFAVTYEINGYCDQPLTIERVYSQLHQNILDLFNEYGVQIMTPAYEHDPEEAKVVPRNQWYASPARPPDASDAPSIPKAS